jgi:hypothetical protein
MSIVVTGDRQTGKTTYAVNWVLADDRRALVVSTHRIAHYVVSQWPAMRGRVYVTSDNPAQFRGRDTSHLAFDEAYVPRWFEDVGLTTYSSEHPLTIRTVPWL